MTKNEVKKRLLLTLSAMTLAMSTVYADDGDFNNGLLKMDMYRSSQGKLNVVLYTSKPFNDAVTVNSRGNNTYVIYLPETTNLLTGRPVASSVGGMLTDVEVKTQIISSQPGKGYTKITLYATTPIQVSASVRSAAFVEKEKVAKVPVLAASQKISAQKNTPKAEIKQPQKPQVKKSETKNLVQNLEKKLAQKTELKKENKKTVEEKKPETVAQNPQAVTPQSKEEKVDIIPKSPQSMPRVPNGFNPSFLTQEYFGFPLYALLTLPVIFLLLLLKLAKKKQQPKTKLNFSRKLAEKPVVNETLQKSDYSEIIDNPDLSWKEKFKAYSDAQPDEQNVEILTEDEQNPTDLVDYDAEIQPQQEIQEFAENVSQNVQEENQVEENPLLSEPEQELSDDLELNFAQQDFSQEVESFEEVEDSALEDADFMEENETVQEDSQFIEDDVNVDTDAYPTPLQDNILQEETFENNDDVDYVENSQLDKLFADEKKNDIFGIDEEEVSESKTFAQNLESMRFDTGLDNETEEPSIDDIFGYDENENALSDIKSSQNDVMQTSEETQFAENEIEDFSLDTFAQADEDFGTEAKEQEVQEVAQSVEPPKEKFQMENANYKIISQVPIDVDKGFYLVEFAGCSSLVGYVGDDITVIKQFDEIIESKVQARLNQGTDYIVKVGRYKALVDVKDYGMSLLIEL